MRGPRSARRYTAAVIALAHASPIGTIPRPIQLHQRNLHRPALLLRWLLSRPICLHRRSLPWPTQSRRSITHRHTFHWYLGRSNHIGTPCIGPPGCCERSSVGPSVCLGGHCFGPHITHQCTLHWPDSSPIGAKPRPIQSHRRSQHRPA